MLNVENRLPLRSLRSQRCNCLALLGYAVIQLFLGRNSILFKYIVVHRPRVTNSAPSSDPCTL